MKVLLYSEGQNAFNKSGVGKALQHQKKALEKNGIPYTLNPEEDYDIAHINTFGLKSRRVLKKSKKKNIPVICHTHTTFEDFKNSFALSNIIAPFIKKLVVGIYSAADYLISPSKYTMELVKGYGIQKGIEPVSNGVDTNKFKKNKELGEKFIKEYNINGPVVICVGLPFARKGIFDFCKIAEEMPEYRFIWFGAKMTYVLPRKVKKLIKNPPSNVAFPGFVPEDTILGAYSAADAFLFLSYEENEGIVVLEALSMECPVVIRDIPVYKEWMQHEVNCHKATDVNGFKKLLMDTSKLKGTVEAGRKTATDRDLQVIGAKLGGIYKKLIDNKMK